VKVIVFDDVLYKRAREYQVPDLEVQFYAHADDAVAVVMRERPDLVLMDYAMGARVSGEDAVRALRGAFARNGAFTLGPSGEAGGAERSALKIVGISSDEHSNERMLAAGADDALPKTHVKGYLSRLSRSKP
jgi:CheY-like chemotaxis protein